MLEHLKLDADVNQAVEKDTLGGGGPLESGVYGLTLKAAYFDQAKSKAISVNLLLETDNGRRVNVTEYITSGEAKGCKPYYVDKQGNKQPLPGYAKMNTLCQLVTGNTIDQLNVEDKILKLYDFTLRQETNQSKKVITELTGAKVKAAVFKVIEDKKSKVGDEYLPTGETREVNDVVKFFTEDGLTLDEKLNSKPADFVNQWEAAHKGKTKDKSTKTAGGAQAGLPTMGAPTAAPVSFD